MYKVTLLSHTPDPQKAVAAAAKLCYSESGIEDLREGLTDEAAGKFVNMLASMGHESPIEHISFTFGIEGVSRALLAQITRHRIASFSVQSQRYVKAEGFEYVIPPAIEADPAAKAEYIKVMQSQQEAYDRLAGLLKATHIQTLLNEGETPESAGAKAEKMAIEDARFVLPNAAATKMVVTMNARSLLNFFRHRCCNRAQWEIRRVADDMLRLVYPVAPGIFKKAGPSCVKGGCPEGKMTCGKISEVRDRYAQLKLEI